LLRGSAEELTGLLAYSVPVVALLEGRNRSERAESRVDGDEYLEALELTRRARYARDFLLLQTAPEPVAIPRQFQKDLELTRARLIECRDPERSDIWFHSLYQLARTMNPMLSPDDAKTVWERIERGACGSRVTPDERQWIDLMKAVGNRAAPDMALIGGLTSPHCARWRSAWSISTQASIASAIGVARIPTQGSWRPVVWTVVGLPLRSIERRGTRMLEVGLSAMLTRTSCPLEMPPRVPPALFER